jgi:hypothetical protein
MKQYSGWQALFLSFWSADLYRDVAKQWQGVGYLYLLAVVSLTVLFVSAQIQVVGVPKAQELVDSIINQLPSIKIEKGKLSIDKASPYVIRDPKSGITLITFDMSDKPMSLAESKGMVLVTTKSVIARKHTSLRKDTGADGRSVVEEVYPLDAVDSFTLDKALVETTIHTFLNWVGVLVFAVWLPFGFLFCVVQTLIYALFGKVFTSMMSVDLGYPTLIRLAAIALTPVLLLDSVVKVSGADPPFWTLCCIVLALGYLWFAVYANSQDKSTTSPLGTTP